LASSRRLIETALAWQRTYDAENDQLCARIEATEKKCLLLAERKDGSIKDRARAGIAAALLQPKDPSLHRMNTGGIGKH